jgi:hypothetical protein
MTFYRNVILFLLLTATGSLMAQQSLRDSVITIPTIRATFGFHLPGGDMARMFGPDFTIGADFTVKTKRNFLVGAEGNFIFGGTVKNDQDVLASISTEQGWVIDQYGGRADIFMYERGYSAFFKLGKVFPLAGPNPNSGFYFTAGPGYLQHKIRIENIEGSAPQVLGDYSKGYDRLSGGFALSEFIGYHHFGNTKLINFFAGIELVQAWTSSYRPYDFNMMARDTEKRFDLLTGIKIGWMIAIYKKVPDSYYYY